MDWDIACHFVFWRVTEREREMGERELGDSEGRFFCSGRTSSGSWMGELSEMSELVRRDE